MLVLASCLGFKSLSKADYRRSSIRFMHGPQKRKSVISCVLPRTVIVNGRESWEGLNSAVFREAALLIPPVTEASHPLCFQGEFTCWSIFTAGLILVPMFFSISHYLVIELLSNYVFFFVVRLMRVLLESSYPHAKSRWRTQGGLD